MLPRWMTGLLFLLMGGSGSKYLQLIMRAVYREATLDYEYNYEEDYSLNFSKLVQVSQQLAEYKSKKNKVDFH